jgi:hypothetical protein
MTEESTSKVIYPEHIQEFVIIEHDTVEEILQLAKDTYFFMDIFRTSPTKFIKRWRRNERFDRFESLLKKNYLLLKELLEHNSLEVVLKRTLEEEIADYFQKFMRIEINNKESRGRFTFEDWAMLGGTVRTKIFHFKWDGKR